MRLKKLELFGFKSFADKTEILFDDGVTCVVGPNGCGKSNISDAIRWVLGERSAKLLRGSKMEDVIFNGTDYRKPLALAEVALTIDNSDRGLPIDYHEVTIARRLYRSGESEYLINKTVCRLKDVQDLILDTGIGSNSYSMIEQGRIDYILNADAEERRFLIEEAAGISKYKVKKEEAIRKLERTEDNRLRLNDIIQEVHRNIQYAERQARRAERYKEQLEQLKALEIRKALHDVKRLTEEKKSAAESQSRLQAELESLEAELAASRSRQDQWTQNLHAIQERHSEEEAKRYQLTSKMDQNAQQIRFHQETRMDMANRAGQMKQELEQLQKRLESNDKDIALKHEEGAQLAQERKAASQTLEAYQKTLREIENQLEHAKFYMNQVKSEAFQSAAETSRIRNEYHRLNAFLETHGEHKRKQDAGSERLRQEMSQWQVKSGNYDQSLQGLNERLQALQVKRSALEQALCETQTRLETERESHSALNQTIREKKTRLEMFQDLHAATQLNEEELLAQAEAHERGFVQTLREIFSVTSGYEWALEAALEAFSRSLIVDNTEMAKKLLSKLREKKTSSLGLLIREIARPHDNGRVIELPSHVGTCRPLKSLVQVKAGYENIFEPFFADVFVVETQTSVDAVHELLPFAWDNKLLTQDGLILGPKGRIFFRNEHPISEWGSVRSQGEMEKIRSEMESLERLEIESAKQIALHQDSLKALQTKKEAGEAERLETALQNESFDSLREGAKDRILSFEREIQLIAFETEEMQSHASKALAQRESLQTQLGRAEELENQIREHQDAIVRDIDGFEQKRMETHKSFAEWGAKSDSLEERSRLINESLTYLKQHHENDSLQIISLREEAVRLQAKEERLVSEDARLKSEQETLDQLRRESEIALGLIRHERESVEEGLSDEREHLQERQSKQREIQGRLHQLEMKHLDLGYQEKTIADRLQQAYRVNLSELRTAEDESEEELPADFEEKILQFKEKVESLGTVNLLAIEEYEELKTRYEFLIAQQQDLDQAREQLMETIRQINRTTKSLFEETFTNVQRTFKEYYETLFRGGEARLVLVDETNPLESGIDIVVRPPGKKLTHISLLSGGEKALTAIALLFALFKIKPSPYCVLDEVDAPLDEANIDRFLTVLRTFLTVTQFIIVTHNRKTIVMGDSLYGVTMQEPGISKIVSVKIIAAVSMAETSKAEDRGKTPVQEQIHA